MLQLSIVFICICGAFTRFMLIATPSFVPSLPPSINIHYVFCQFRSTMPREREESFVRTTPDKLVRLRRRQKETAESPNAVLRLVDLPLQTDLSNPSKCAENEALRSEGTF